MGSLLKLIVHGLLDVTNALAEFFTLHFGKMMTLTGIVLAIVCASIFMGTKK